MNGRLMTSWYPMSRLRSEFDEVLEDVFGDVLGIRRPRYRNGYTFPAVNLWDDEENLYAEAEVPGMTMEDLELLVQGNELAIRGERSTDEREGVTYHRRERGQGRFSGTIRLPVEIDAENVEAVLANGVLTITMPKAPTARPRKIEVSAAK